MQQRLKTMPEPVIYGQRFPQLIASIPLAFALLAVMALAACQGAPASTTEPSEAAAPARDRLTSSDFEIVVYEGADILGAEKLRFSDVLGKGKPVVLNFWAGACPPCRVELPAFQETHEQYKDRVIIFGLDVGPFVGLGSRDDGQRLLRDLNITFPTGTTFSAEVVRSYRIAGMPTTIFLKPDGQVNDRWTGALPHYKLAQLVEELLAASNSG